MGYQVEPRIDLVTFASSVSILKPTSNIELLAVAFLITQKEILKVQISHVFNTKLILV